MCRYFTFILIMMCCKSLSSFQSIRPTATCCSLPPRASKCTLLRGAETRVKVRARPVICLVSGSWRGEIQIGFSWARLLPSSRDAAHRCPNPRADGCLYPHGFTQRRARGTMKGGTNKHTAMFSCTSLRCSYDSLFRHEFHRVAHNHPCLSRSIYLLAMRTKAGKGNSVTIRHRQVDVAARDGFSEEKRREREREERWQKRNNSSQQHRRVCFATEHHG